MTDAELLDSVEKALAGDPRVKLVMPEVTIEKLASRLRRARESEARLARLLRDVGTFLERLSKDAITVNPAFAAAFVGHIHAALKAMEDGT